MEFKCNICIKLYKSYQSLWNHNYKYHKVNINLVSKNNPNEEQNVFLVSKNNPKVSIIDKTVCVICNKKFSAPQNRWKHEQKCKSRLNKNIVEQHENKIKEFEETIKILKAQIEGILKEKGRLHHKTLNKINNQVNGNVNNTVNNTINIVKLGCEDLNEVLSETQKLYILSQCDSLAFQELVKMVHLNDKFPQFKNFAITNVKGDIAYKFDDEINKFILVSKEELLRDIYEIRIGNISEFYGELKDKISPKIQEHVIRFLDKADTDNYFKDVRLHDLKLLMYNNRDKVKLL